jgi:hypothetical protein
MALWLHVATHDTKGGSQLHAAQISEHTRDDGMIWTFVGGKKVWMCGWVKNKARATVLEREAIIDRNYTAAEAGKGTIDE